MSNNFQDLGQKFQDLATRSLREQVRAAQRYNELAQRFGRGELFRNAMRDEYARFVNEETVRYMSNMVSLGLDYYNNAFELGRAFNERFFEQVTERPGAAKSAANESSASKVSNRRVAIDMHGVVGEETTRAFTLESKQPDATEISFLVSDFTGPIGKDPFRANLEFQPERFTLEPGEERVVTIRLRLSKESFAPGSMYTATVIVRGYGDLELEIRVFPDPPIETSTPRRQSRRKKSTGKR